MLECLEKEAVYRTSRSSGPGGQHANKTESRVELHWDMEASGCISAKKKALLRKRLGPKLTGRGVLVLSCETHRSQFRNKEEVTGRFLKLVTSNLAPEKKRKPTGPTRRSVEKRIRNKKQRGEIKRIRKKPPPP